MSAMKAKHQRLILVILALVAVIGAGLIATWAVRNQANLFYLPEQMAENPPETGRAVRLGDWPQHRVGALRAAGKLPRGRVPRLGTGSGIGEGRRGHSAEAEL